MRVFLFGLFLFLFLFVQGQTLEVDREFRGVWLTTAYNLDWPTHNKDNPAKQQEDFIRYLDKIDSMNMNAVIVQIRAAADAFYQSNYEPWSYWLTGEQGKAPEPFYDPLEFMIEACHQRGIQFHAWFNLLRAVPHEKFFPPTKDHVSRKHRSWTYKSGNALYFDPGIPAVRQYLINVILDVVNRYDIDGVHLDDYFYPQEINGNTIKDQRSFKKYEGDYTNIKDWRRDNVNKLVYALSDSIHKTKKWVWFGISPIAVWRHKNIDSLGSMTKSAMTSYDDLYADSKLWAQNGWVDYIMPQLYAGTGARDADIVTMSNWWRDCGSQCQLWGGLAYYKTSIGKESYWRDTSEINNQILLLRNRTFSGICLYKGKDFLNPTKGVEECIKNTGFVNEVFLPVLDSKDSIPPNEPEDLRFVDKDSVVTLQWQTAQPAKDGDTAYRYHVYVFENISALNFNKSSNYLGFTSSNEFLLREQINGFYIVLAEDRNGNIRYSNRCIFLKK